MRRAGGESNSTLALVSRRLSMIYGILWKGGWEGLRRGWPLTTPLGQGNDGRGLAVGAWAGDRALRTKFAMTTGGDGR